MYFERIGGFFKLQAASGMQYDQCIIEKVHIEQLLLLKPDTSLPVTALLEEKCKLFFDNLRSTVLPTWHLRGEIPRLALRPLLKLIELYFEERNSAAGLRKFSQELFDWAKSLPEYATDPSAPTDDVYCLYGQVIQVQKKPMYLIEILLDFIQGHQPFLDEKIKGLARWLSEYDASFIVSNLELKATYAELNVGPAFSIEMMRKCLAALPVTCSRVQEGIDLLLIQSESKVKIDVEIIQVLSEIYRLRWLQIIEDKLPDYLGFQQGDNAPWIRLAQLVCGAGCLDLLREIIKPKGNLKHFKENYYRFLMPTIKCDTDPVQLNGIASHALNHLILSHSGRYLILLDNCVAGSKVSKKFYNWNTRQPRPLSEIEIERIQFSRFRAYMPHALQTTKAEDLPISKNTIIGIKALVEGSFYTKGLYDNYADAEMLLAGKAYHLFYNFLRDLPPDERERLLKQRIILGKKNKTVDEIFDHVDNNGEDGCIAGCAELLTQLLLDYDPNEHLSSELEESVVRYKMRENSRKKVYRDYDGLSDEEARRRILILAVSIMSQPFEYSLSADCMSLWDCSNRLVGTTKNIFKLIKPMIKANNFKDARHVYATIIESLAKPAVINNNSSWTAWFMPNSVRQRWLKSVANETLFKQPSLWFEPQFLLERLLSPAQMGLPISPVLEKFLDELVYTYAQPQSTLLKDIRINIRFSQLLNSLDVSLRQQLLAFLQPSSHRVDENQRIFLNYLIYRLAMVGATAGNWSFSFFGQPSFDRARLKDLTAVLENSISSLNPKEIRTLENKIGTMTQSVCGSYAKSSMIGYLQEMMSAIEPIHSDRSKSPLPLLYSEFFSIVPNA